MPSPHSGLCGRRHFLPVVFHDFEVVGCEYSCLQVPFPLPFHHCIPLVPMLRTIQSALPFLPALLRGTANDHQQKCRPAPLRLPAAPPTSANIRAPSSCRVWCPDLPPDPSWRPTS